MGCKQLKNDLTGVGARNVYTFANGDTFNPDLTYRTWNPWSGSTLNFDEVKAVVNLTASSENIAQVENYQGRGIPFGTVLTPAYGPLLR